jgi:hypothetical protein
MRGVRLIVSLLVIGTLLLGAVPASAANQAGAQKVAWNLSAAVMPVPPYGTMDIPGSDSASNLIVNRPNGEVRAILNGSMKDLHPNTTYTVYLSKGYTPYVLNGWNVAGSYDVNIEYLGTNYAEVLVLTQSGTSITGVSLALFGGGSPWTIDSGSVSGTAVSLHAFYNANPAMRLGMQGTIAANGSMSGTWADEAPGTRTGTWATTSGQATNAGSTGWPGLFSATVPEFTFTTNLAGNGNWHLNLRDDDFAGPGTYALSVWINEAGATILISNSFEVTIP